MKEEVSWKWTQLFFRQILMEYFHDQHDQNAIPLLKFIIFKI